MSGISELTHAPAMITLLGSGEEIIRIVRECAEADGSLEITHHGFILNEACRVFSESLAQIDREQLTKSDVLLIDSVGLNILLAMKVMGVYDDKD